jgi:membrane protein implicated in regulation of membrane protease activity
LCVKMLGMNQKTKELWIVPTIIALATGIPLGAGFMFFGLWLGGTPIHPSFSLDWLKLALLAPLPVWVTLAVLFVTVIVTGLLFRQRARTADEVKQRSSANQAVSRLENQIAKLNQEHASEMEALNAKSAKLHGVWNNSQTYWHLGRKGQEPMMQIGGWIDLTSFNTEDVTYLLAAYISGKRSDMFMDVAVKPNMVNCEQVMLHMVPPLETDDSKPFTATIVVEDQYNRKYELPVHTFRATPTPPAASPPPPQNAKKPSPILHASWRGDSVWGWATPLFLREEDPTYIVRGDVTLLMDNIADSVIITGVEIEDAECVGKFDNFQLDPNQPVTRGMRLFFRGEVPEGTDDYTVKLLFKDLKGNRYPTVEHRFKPLPIDERVAVERGRIEKP